MLDRHALPHAPNLAHVAINARASKTLDPPVYDAGGEVLLCRRREDEGVFGVVHAETFAADLGAGLRQGRDRRGPASQGAVGRVFDDCDGEDGFGGEECEFVDFVAQLAGEVVQESALGLRSVCVFWAAVVVARAAAVGFEWCDGGLEDGRVGVEGGWDEHVGCVGGRLVVHCWWVSFFCWCMK